MKTYRAYRVDKGGKIKAGEWLLATDDADARRQAEAFLREPATPKVELWQGGHLICELTGGDRRGAPPPPRHSSP
jgi:hypothetical protein